ncbi:hypothetical protein DFJ58DRAFT_725568 [Suillus subalutaceus]|uniref:uncharacterized protein n=1 Tax=Suillus subalutaceus TaxID=48586 RepID=UPI001B874527|nr:uncharacterized protein DFJ58DRAFT_725568 [Suillus subalutaceus]KAG1861725.1 hypothetical protein DFJ58DRAFT_725568 [Suillus subalutaceus]
MKRPQLTVVHLHRATTAVESPGGREILDASLREETYYHEYKDSFAREVEAYGCFGHIQSSTIPQLRGSGRSHGESCAISPRVLFMEYIPGENLTITRDPQSVQFSIPGARKGHNIVMSNNHPRRGGLTL